MRGLAPTGGTHRRSTSAECKGRATPEGAGPSYRSRRARVKRRGQRDGALLRRREGCSGCAASLALWQLPRLTRHRTTGKFPGFPNLGVPLRARHPHYSHERTAVHRPGRTHALRPHPSLRQQERRAADRRRRAAHRSAGAARERPAHPRRRDARRAARSRSARTAEWTARNTLDHPRDGRSAPSALDPALCASIRASILLAGPLLARCGAVTLPPPGRRRDRPPARGHALPRPRAARGAASSSGDALRAQRASGLRGADVFLDEPSVTATENALMAAVAADGPHDPPQRGERAARAGPRAAFSSRWARSIEGIGTNTITIHGGQPLHGATHRDRPRPHRGRLVHRARRGHAIRASRIEERRRRAPALHAAGLRAARRRLPRRGRRPRRPGRAGPRDPEPISAAHVPSSRISPGPRSRPTSMSIAHRHGDAVRGADPHAREDVRVAPVLRGQADRHGRAHRAVRSAPRARRRARRRCAAARVESPGHPRRHGDAARGALRRRARARSTTSGRSSAATSASTSGSARSAPRSTRVEDRRGERRRRVSARTRRRGGRRGLRAFGVTAFTTTRDAGSFGTGSPTSRCATSCARWERAARLDCASPAIRASRPRRRCTARAVSSTRAAGDGWLRASTTRTAIFALVRGTAMAVTVADCVPDLHRAPGGRRGGRSTRAGAARPRGSWSAAIARFERAGSRRRASCSCTVAPRSAGGATR